MAQTIESACSAGDLDSILGSGRSPGEGNGLPTPVFLPGKSHGQRSLAGYSLLFRKESDTSERLHFLLSVVKLFQFLVLSKYFNF